MHSEGKNIESIISNLKEAAESEEYRIKINRAEFKEYANEIIEDLKKFAEGVDSWTPVENNYEGVRFNCNGEDEQAWFLLRVSLHEPLLVLNIESDLPGACKKIYKSLEGFFKGYELSL